MKNIVVVGAGISGLSTAFYIQKKLNDADIDFRLRVIEAEDRTGGKIRTESKDGYILEWGPNGFLDNKPWTLEMCEHLDLTEALYPADDSAKKRYIYSEGKLHRLPGDPISFFTSDLLSIKGRLRIIGELWAKSKPENEDETLADFARRRLGREAYEKLLDPMVSGVFAGNPENMSLKSSFPRIAELEENYGSLIKAMIQLKWERRNEDENTGGPSGPGGTLTSFENGLEQLPDTIVEKLEGEVLTGTPIERIESIDEENEDFRLFSRERHFDADAVVFAIPAYNAKKVFRGFDSGIAELLSEIPYSPLTVVGTGGDAGDIKRNLDGFGFLIPSREKRDILGALWTSTIFKNRAPKNKYLLRTMIGGARHPEIVKLDDNEFVERALREQDNILGLEKDPGFVETLRHPKAIPQYPVGHNKRLEEMEERLNSYPGLFLTGNAFRGIGLNDCVKASLSTSDDVMEFIREIS